MAQRVQPDGQRFGLVGVGQVDHLDQPLVVVEVVLEHGFGQPAGDEQVGNQAAEVAHRHPLVLHKLRQDLAQSGPAGRAERGLHMKSSKCRHGEVLLADQLIDARTKPHLGQVGSQLADQHRRAHDRNAVSFGVPGRTPTAGSVHLDARRSNPSFEGNEYLRLRGTEALQLPQHRSRPVAGHTASSPSRPLHTVGPGQRPVGRGVPTSTHSLQTSGRSPLAERVTADAERFGFRSAEHAMGT